MADYSVTATSVLKGDDGQARDGIAGAAITAGQTVYLDSTDSSLKLADANGAAATRTTVGIALNGGGVGQPIKYLTSGTYTPGFTLAAGTVVILSATPGGLAPVADAASGYYITVVGIGTGTNKMKLVLAAAGVAVP